MDGIEAVALAVAVDAVIPGPMSGLPEECVAMILSLLPIDSVFRCMSVNRKWESAAKYVIKHHKSLSLRRLAQCETCKVTGRACDSCRRKRCEDGVIGVDDFSDFAVIRSLNQVQGLQVLHLNGMKSGLISYLILQNAETLRVLTGILWLPISPPLVYNKLVKLECCVFDGIIASACPNLVDLTLKDSMHGTQSPTVSRSLPLITMTQLQRLDVQGTTRNTVNFLIKNASVLKKIRCIREFPVQDNDQPVMFPQLQMLQLHNTSPAPVSFSNCPKLELLNVTDMGPNVSLEDLPVDSMWGLGLIFRPDLTDFTILTPVVRCISRFQNLTKMRLQMSSRLIRIEEGNIIATLFDELHALTFVEMTLHHEQPVMDLTIDRLIRGNPMLQMLWFKGFRISDPVIESMSHLTDLRDVIVPGSVLTTAGIMKLLTGPSSRSLTQLKVIGGVRVNMDHVEEQFVLMMTGRGLSADTSKWYKRPNSGDFYFSAKL